MTDSRAPRGLKAGGKALWNQVKSGWNVPQEMEKLLLNVCQVQDRIDKLHKIIQREGPVTRNKWGVLVAHPAATLLKGETSSFAQLYRLLMLEAPSGADVRPGRPDGWTPEG